MERSSLYKLNKDVLIKIIESGFNVNNLSCEECKELKNKCKERIQKCKTENVKNCIKESIKNKFDNPTKFMKSSDFVLEDKEVLINLVNQITEIWIEDIKGSEGVCFCSDKNFEISFISFDYDDYSCFANDKYIALYDIVTGKMKNVWKEFLDSKGNANPALYMFYRFMKYHLDPDDILHILKN